MILDAKKDNAVNDNVKYLQMWNNWSNFILDLNLIASCLENFSFWNMQFLIRYFYIFNFYTLSGYTCSALARNSEGCVFTPHCCIKSCDFFPAFASCNMWSSGGTAPFTGGNGDSIESTIPDVIVHSLLWSTPTGRSSLGYFSSITASSL